jgi:hypothetical protein
MVSLPFDDMIASSAGIFCGRGCEVRTTAMIAMAVTTTDMSITDPITSDTADSRRFFFIRSCIVASLLFYPVPRLPIVERFVSLVYLIEPGTDIIILKIR